jgi:hypothetical protein
MLCGSSAPVAVSMASRFPFQQHHSSLHIGGLPRYQAGYPYR